jgi:hypothetical protein
MSSALIDVSFKNVVGFFSQALGSYYAVSIVVESCESVI